MNKAPRKVHVVSHTHWDREWYLTFHEFRVNLIGVMQKILRTLEEEPEYKHFLMDGQAAALEDYLEIHPEDGERIAGLCRSGALSLGPWYVLPDEFLVSGESMVRNLLVGHQVCGRFGGAQKVGYMPDSFGHFAQIPQLLRKAGIDSFIYTRGNGDEIDRLGCEFRWQAPDGSEVLAIHQWDGYCNAAGLGFKEIWHAHTRRTVDLDLAVQKVKDLFDGMADHCRGEVYLLNNGCDHFPPQQEFAAILSRLRKEFPQTEFVHGPLRDYLQDIRESGIAKEKHQGDLLGGKHHPILSGVWSARMYLKQLNDECQTLLAHQFEPMMAYMHFLQDGPYPHGLANYMWKQLLLNHPHDSICGCSTDDVHRDMMPRFAGVLQTGRQQMSQAMDRLAPRFAREEKDDRETVLTVFNPLPERRSEVVDRLVVLQPMGYELNRLALFDEKGAEVFCEVLDQDYVERFWGIDYRAQLTADEQEAQFATYCEHFGDRILRPVEEADRADSFLILRFLATDLPPVGHARYFLREREEAAEAPEPAAPLVLVTENALENAHCRVELNPNGTFNLTDKNLGRVHRNLGLFVDGGDIGDEYDFCAPDQDQLICSSSSVAEVHPVEPGGFTGALEVTYQLDLPARILADRLARSDERVSCEVCLRLTLKGDAPWVDLDVWFENAAEDHRLQLMFPTDCATDRLTVDGHFYLHERPLIPKGGEGWVQPHPGTHPQQEFSALRDENGGLAVFVRGLPEVVGFQDPDRGAGWGVTLLRSVGWLSRDDFGSRCKNNAGPTIFTPDAQGLGMHHFHLAVLPLAGDTPVETVKAASTRWRTGLLTGQGVFDGSLAGGEGLVERGSQRTAITAIKKHETRDTLIIRLYNLTGSRVEETMRFCRPVTGAWTVDLLEDNRHDLTPSMQTELLVSLGAHEIVTIEVAF